MNHLRWMGHSATIYDIQRNLRSDLESCDVTIVGKGHSVQAHRFVLSSCSDMLRSILLDHPMGQPATVIVPDMKGVLLDSVLAFIYMGETNVCSSNLTEFLEAINILGIKSAISFECNTAALTSASSSSIKPISGIQIGQEEIIVHENIEASKIVTESVLTPQQSSTRELEFLDVYNEPPHKITYSIEHVPGSTNGNEFILTENSGTFTLTQDSKIETVSGMDSEKIDDTEEDDNDDNQIIEEFTNSPNDMIEIADQSSGNVASNETPTRTVVQLKSKWKTLKVKSDLESSAEQQTISTTLDTSEDPIGALRTTTTDYKYACPGNHETTSIEAAVQAVINEGLSLQKAAAKYEISKTVLWRRVRKHPNYMKTARQNPVLSLAYERLKGGESLKSISRELEIPMSTLHRHKVRLSQEGRLPDYVTFKKRDSVSKDELKIKLAKAVHACVHEGMSQNHAANLFDIPKSTLWRHLQKRVAEAEMSHRIHTQDDIKEEIILS